MLKPYVQTSKRLELERLAREHRSSRTGRLICPCNRGYASEDKEGEHYGLCAICFPYTLTCAERKKRKLKLL